MVKLRIGSAVAALAMSAILLGMAGCSDFKDTYRDEPVDELYNTAVDAMMEGEYTKAGTAFDEVDRQHPYSVWATKAQLMSAYTAYQNNHFDDAIAAADRFIQLHPGNRDTAYAYYIKAICYYEQIVDVQRDQRDTENALKALQEVINRFPTSVYARDARLKLDLTRDHLAGKEMEIGRYYEQRKLYIAAINRFSVVVTNYQTTTHLPEALARLTECYEALGLTAEAQKNAAVLGYNFPDNQWYQDSYDLLNGKRNGDGTVPGWFKRNFGSLL